MNIDELSEALSNLRPINDQGNKQNLTQFLINNNSDNNDDIDDICNMLTSNVIVRVRSAEEETAYLILMANKLIHYNECRSENNQKFIEDLIELFKYYKYICTVTIDYYINIPRHFTRIKIIDRGLEEFFKIIKNELSLFRIYEIAYKIFAHMYVLNNEIYDMNTDIYNMDISLPIIAFN